MKKKWEIYNPEWIVKIAIEQISDRPEIIKALSECTNGFKKSRTYIYFVNGENPNRPNSEWQFQESITLENKTNGTIILDILKGNRIGGVEFLM